MMSTRFLKISPYVATLNVLYQQGANMAASTRLRFPPDTTVYKYFIIKELAQRLSLCLTNSSKNHVNKQQSAVSKFQSWAIIRNYHTPLPALQSTMSTRENPNEQSTKEQSTNIYNSKSISWNEIVLITIASQV